MFDTQWEETRPAIERRCKQLAWQQWGDLYSETYLKAKNGYKGFNGTAAFKTWVMSICRNAFLDMCKKKKRTLPLEYAENIPAKDDIFRIGEQVETVSILENGLDPKDWDLLRTVYMDQVTYQELAEQLEIPIGTVKSRINRARKRALKLVSLQTDRSQK